VGQLRGREFVNCIIKLVAHAPNYTGVSVNGLGLQAFEFEVLQVGAVRVGKGFGENGGVMATGIGRHGQTPDKLKITCPTIEA
jgi:hypothetical protein